MSSARNIPSSASCNGSSSALLPPTPPSSASCNGSSPPLRPPTPPTIGSSSPLRPPTPPTINNNDASVIDLEALSIRDNETAGKDEEQFLYDPSLLCTIDFSSTTSPHVNFSPAITPSRPGPGLKVRPLMSGDYDRGFLEILRQLTKVGDVTREQFMKRFSSMKASGDYFVTVIEDTDLGKVIGSATLAVEQKFIHGCATRGMLEDVVVSDQYRGRQLGKLIVATLSELARLVRCYKVSLSCKDSMVKFYGGLGYALEPGNGNYMQLRL